MDGIAPQPAPSPPPSPISIAPPSTSTAAISTIASAVTRDDQLAELAAPSTPWRHRSNACSMSRRRRSVSRARLHRPGGAGQSLPAPARGIANLDLHGVCRPARSVCGDYYDFLVFHKEAHDGTPAGRETGVGIAIGDISGKGISAALLMATLHSAVRAYRFASEELVFSESTSQACSPAATSASDCDELFQSPGRILSLLNRHLYRSTQPEKYATLFLAHYDAELGQADLLERRPAAAARARASTATSAGSTREEPS